MASRSSSSFRQTLHRFRTLTSTYRPYAHAFVFSLCAWKVTIDHIVYIPSVIGPSMAPSLSPTYHETGRKDRILLWKVNPLDGLKRGDVVSMWKPHDPEQTSLKRVVALEGDVVVMRDRERDKLPVGKRGEEEVLPTIRVPYGHVWVEGDNWRKSLDSNDFGPVSKSMIEGRALGVVWPPSRWGDIPDKRDKKYRTIVIKGPAKMQVPPEWE